MTAVSVGLLGCHHSRGKRCEGKQSSIWLTAAKPLQLGQLQLRWQTESIVPCHVKKKCNCTYISMQRPMSVLARELEAPVTHFPARSAARLPSPRWQTTSHKKCGKYASCKCMMAMRH